MIATQVIDAHFHSMDARVETFGAFVHIFASLLGCVEFVSCWTSDRWSEQAALIPRLTGIGSLKINAYGSSFRTCGWIFFTFVNINAGLDLTVEAETERTFLQLGFAGAGVRANCVLTQRLSRANGWLRVALVHIVTNSRFGVEFETSWAGPSVVANIRLLRRWSRSCVGTIFTVNASETTWLINTNLEQHITVVGANETFVDICAGLFVRSQLVSRMAGAFHGQSRVRTLLRTGIIR